MVMRGVTLYARDDAGMIVDSFARARAMPIRGWRLEDARLFDVGGRNARRCPRRRWSRGDHADQITLAQGRPRRRADRSCPRSIAALEEAGRRTAELEDRGGTSSRGRSRRC